ncbi:flagellar hook-basal body complex protein [Butyrivibrio sp. INlla21]|uniref:flagellar hook-basal body complex protein n=1 Tax=Butyrivibrio sp. INlla21 TaxID=1520811 RepID=UPI0008F433B0|nr:flagellar hook-basal body complex protein [Butyrivibrio sp. INlla21]SFU40904.1 flagellar hook protein FlgE [Butyrivibrio sp. INlla21]
MMRSLYSGVAGLKTHQTKMDVIGNNIANVNTTSFKSQSITFSDLMYQTTQTASGATETKGGVNARQIGLGAKSGAINTAITAQGATQTTNNPFDIMITGESFFVVNNGTQNLYTRDGSFYVDGAGNLAMQSNGYLVQGWAAKEDRETGEITINKGTLTGLQIMSAANYTYAPASTTAGLVSGNIDARDKNVQSDDGKTITLEFYDNKGYLYTGKFVLKDTKPEDEHMYALTLTDIIDSNGKSINENENMYDLMSQITFGNTEASSRSSKPSKTEPNYSIVAGTDSAHVVINKADGDVKFDNVPATGNLKNLMSAESAGNSPYANLLSNAYGLSDDAVKAQLGDAWETAQYTIDSSGELTIRSEVSDFPSPDSSDSYVGFNTTKFANIDFRTPNETVKYYTQIDGNVAYKVPTAVPPEAKELTADLLSDVFGINQTYGDEYRYEMTAGGKLNIYKKTTNINASADNTITPEAKAQMEFFKDANGNSLIDAIDGYTGTGVLKYTYTDGKLTLKLTVNQPTTITETIQTDVSANGQGASDLWSQLGISDWATAASYDQIAAWLTTADTTDPALADAIASANAIMTAISANSQLQGKDTSTFMITLANVTGTNGFNVDYDEYNDVTTDYPSAGVSYENKAAVSASPITTAFTTKTPAYVYTSVDTYGKSYFVPEDKLEKTVTKDTASDNMNADFISNVFGIDVSTLTDGTEYTLSIDKKTGGIKISHYQNGTPNPLVGEYSGQGMFESTGDGKFRYKTSKAYVDVPTTGNIADLLEKASSTDDAAGRYAGVLSKVYGITDDMARAYGTDGTYTIDNTPGSATYGQITLTTGKHTVQLKFNADDGSILSADNDKNAKINMTFGQGYPGLEAFGFQASPNNAAEQERAYTISFDFTTLTNYNTNGSSTITATKGDLSSLNTGRAVGEMNGVSVGTDGRIFANYSNGQTKLLGQIASAEFANASGLSKEGDNLYASTLNSGEATIQDITTDGGYMNTGVLEMSNVDLSQQFTEMITTQRGFQANSRIITVSDTLLEELTNLKR